MSASSNPTNCNLHTRPRLGSIDISTLPPAPQAHGVLSPGAMRRVREYVEAHFGESIDLLVLAEVAGLSVHHFARQFKQSAGVTPHVYLTQKRVERAREMLVQTDLSLAEIAFTVGFCDQGHLARHFRDMLGTTPREFRWSPRQKQTAFLGSHTSHSRRLRLARSERGKGRCTTDNEFLPRICCNA